LTDLLHLAERPKEINLLASNGKYVTADDAGALPLIANRDAVGGWERFDVTYLSGDLVNLRAHANGKYVAAARGPAR
jgi:hypothetical protein